MDDIITRGRSCEAPGNDLFNNGNSLSATVASAERLIAGPRSVVIHWVGGGSRDQADLPPTSRAEIALPAPTKTPIAAAIP